MRLTDHSITPPTENCVVNLRAPFRPLLHPSPPSTPLNGPTRKTGGRATHLQGYRTSKLEWRGKQQVGPLCWLRFPAARAERPGSVNSAASEAASARRFTARTRTPTAPGARSRRRQETGRAGGGGGEAAARLPLSCSHGRPVADSPRKHEGHAGGRAGRPLCRAPRPRSPGRAGSEPHASFRSQHPGHKPAPRRPPGKKPSARYLTLRAGPRAGASATVVDFERHPDTTLASALGPVRAAMIVFPKPVADAGPRPEAPPSGPPGGRAPAPPQPIRRPPGQQDTPLQLVFFSPLLLPVTPG